MVHQDYESRAVLLELPLNNKLHHLTYQSYTNCGATILHGLASFRNIYLRPTGKLIKQLVGVGIGQARESSSTLPTYHLELAKKFNGI